MKSFNPNPVEGDNHKQHPEGEMKLGRASAILKTFCTFRDVEQQATANPKLRDQLFNKYRGLQDSIESVLLTPDGQLDEKVLKELDTLVAVGKSEFTQDDLDQFYGRIVAVVVAKIEQKETAQEETTPTTSQTKPQKSTSRAKRPSPLDIVLGEGKAPWFNPIDFVLGEGKAPKFNPLEAVLGSERRSQESREAREKAEQEAQLKKEAFEELGFPVIAKIHKELNAIYEQYYRPKSDTDYRGKKLEGTYKKFQKLLDRSLRDDFERAVIEHFKQYGAQQEVRDDFQQSSFLTDKRNRLEAREVLHREHLQKFVPSNKETTQALTEQRDKMKAEAEALTSTLDEFGNQERKNVCDRIEPMRKELDQLTQNIKRLDDWIEGYTKLAKETADKGKEKKELSHEDELFNIATRLEELSDADDKFHRLKIPELIGDSLREILSREAGPIKSRSDVIAVKLRDFAAGRVSLDETLKMVNKELSFRLGVPEGDRVKAQLPYQIVEDNLWMIDQIRWHLDNEQPTSGQAAA